MRKILALSILLCLLCVPGLAEDELTIVHVTDMHYLSPALTDYGEGFMEIIENADGKVTHYTPQLMQAFVEEMLHLQPDAIILSGDLTLNGAARSHAELVELLAPLARAGIRVLALPGNHDTNTAGYQFAGHEVIPVEGLADADFPTLYAELGYAGAASRDEASASYVAELTPDVWCLLADVNANGTAGTVNEETFVWIEEQLIRAQGAGATVIAVSHQPALVHNSIFTFGYIINNNTRLLELYEKYRVQLNLCGHLHMQHLTRSDALVEIAASSLAVAPNQYGVLRVEAGQLTDYAMRSLDVSAWAVRTGQTDPALMNFAAYSGDFFDQTTRRQVQAMLSEASVIPEDAVQMTDFAVKLNAEYFAGLRTLTAEDPAWALWETHGSGTFFTYYLRSILNEPLPDMTRFSFQTAE